MFYDEDEYDPYYDTNDYPLYDGDEVMSKYTDDEDLLFSVYEGGGVDFEPGVDEDVLAKEYGFERMDGNWYDPCVRDRYIEGCKAGREMAESMWFDYRQMIGI